jgi:hypothetical protein
MYRAANPTKQLPLLSIMAKLGHQPLVQAAGGEYYFLSPFREERTPSFVVNEPKNVWADFGEAPESGQKVYGGDVLKLIMRLTGLELPLAKQVLASWAADLPEVAAMLASTPAATRDGQTVRSGALTFTDVRTERLSWNVLVDYLTGRGINWPLVQQSERHMAHLQQIFYQVAGKPRQKPYFGLAWKTEGGWEVRSKNFQGTIGQKGVTWLPGKVTTEVVVFEGFMDYLSALTYYKRPSFDSTVLVLNSVNLLGEVLPQLREYQVIHWWGDNDAAGERALHVLRQAAPGRVKAYNEHYRGFKDFNDWLTNTPPSKLLPPRRAEASRQSQKALYWLWVVFAERVPGTPVAAGKRRQCTFYSYTNDAEGLAQLRTLRNQLGDQLAYYRLCERTKGRAFTILEWAGTYQPQPQSHESAHA